MNTISAWDIYWVMQLDSIHCAIFILALALSAISLIGLVSTWWNNDFAKIYENSTYEEGKKKYAQYTASIETGKKTFKRFLPYAFAAISVASFLPSSRTAAAMIVIPAIASNETIQREAGDLYQIAKDGLRELVKPDAPKEVEKPK